MCRTIGINMNMTLAAIIASATIVASSGVAWEAEPSQPIDSSADMRSSKRPAMSPSWPTTTYDYNHWQARRDWLIEQARIAAGFVPEQQRQPIDARISADKTVGDGYTIEKITYTNSVGQHAIGRLYRPTDGQDSPVVTGKHPVVFYLRDPAIHERHKLVTSNYASDTCATLARNGMIVFINDDNSIIDDNRNASASNQPATQPTASMETPELALWGIGRFQLQMLDNVRILDFLLSLHDVDRTRVGLMTAPDQNTQALTLATADGRITALALSDAIFTAKSESTKSEPTKSSADDPSNDVAPLLYVDAHAAELAAAFAPNPIFVPESTSDTPKSTGNVKQGSPKTLTQTSPPTELSFVRNIYDLYKVPTGVNTIHERRNGLERSRVANDENEIAREKAEAATRFFARHFLKRDTIPFADKATLTEKISNVPSDEASKAPSTKNDLEQAFTPETIERLKKEFAAQLGRYEPTTKQRFEDLRAMTRSFVQHAAGTRWPCSCDVKKIVAELTPSPTGEFIQYDGTLERDGRFVKIRGFSHPTRSPTSYTICVNPNGLAATDANDPLMTDLIAGLIAANQRVVFIEPFSTGSNLRPINTFSTTPPPASTTPLAASFTTYHRTDVGEAVYDIITTLIAATEHHLSPEGLPTMVLPGRIRLIGIGRMGPVCLLARAMLPEYTVQENDVRLMADMNTFDADLDAAYIDQLFVPYIRHFGGLPAIAAAASNGPLWLHNTAGKLNSRWVEQATRITQAPVQVDAAPADSAAVIGWIRSSLPSNARP